MSTPSLGICDTWKGRTLQEFCAAFHIHYEFQNVPYVPYWGPKGPETTHGMVIQGTPLTPGSMFQQPIIDHITGNLATEAFIWLQGQPSSSRYEGAHVIRFVHAPLITITGEYEHTQKSALAELKTRMIEQAVPLPEALIDIIDKKYA